MKIYGSKTIQGRAMKRDEQIGSDEHMTWLTLR